MTDFASFDRICNIISELRNKKAAFTFHTVGDRDGVGSAIALSKCFSDAVVVTPDFITNNAKRMLKQAKFKGQLLDKLPWDREVVIVTDANNLDALGGMKRELLSREADLIFIDHHAVKDYTLGKSIIVFNDENYNSASSIVYEILKRNGEKVDEEAAMLLLNGIIADSSDFQNATALTFKQVAELLEIADTSYSEIVEYFHQDVQVKDRYALMKDLFGAKIEVVGDYILMHGKAGGAANLAAETAINFGADGSVFWSERKEEVTVSARLRSPLDRRLGMHLGRMMQETGRSILGSGGGHPCAAGAYGPGKENLEGAVKALIDAMRERFQG